MWVLELQFPPFFIFLLFFYKAHHQYKPPFFIYGDLKSPFQLNFFFLTILRNGFSFLMKSTFSIMDIDNFLSFFFFFLNLRLDLWARWNERLYPIDWREKEGSREKEGEKEGVRRKGRKKILNPVPNTHQKKKIQELFLSQRLSEFVSGTHDGFLQLLP